MSGDSKHASSRPAHLAVALLILVVSAHFAACAPAIYDYDSAAVRDLYEMLLRQQEAPSQFVHQMERKGGRSPTLRLRFGRRSDPLWSKLPSVGGGAIGNEDNLSEKVTYK